MAAYKAAAQGELVVDDRGRTSLAKVRSTGAAGPTRYRAEEFPGGIMLLVPLTTVDAAEVPEGMRERLSERLTSEDAVTETAGEDWRE